MGSDVFSIIKYINYIIFKIKIKIEFKIRYIFRISNKKIKTYFLKIVIILIVFLSSKLILNVNYKDQILWLVYILNKNLDLKTWYSQT